MKKNLFVPLYTLFFILWLTIPVHSGDSSRKITVSLELSSTRVLIGENPLCTLIIKNDGNKPINVIHPDFDGGGLSFRTINISTGETSTVEEITGRGGASHQFVNLPPGEEIKTYFSLFDKIELNEPGEYMVSTISMVDDSQHPVESNLVRIKLRHFSVINPYLPPITSQELDSIFIDPSVNPAEVIMASFNISNDGGLQNIKRIAKAQISTQPYVSTPPNKGWAEHRWFAWMEANYLKTIFLDGLTEKQVETNLQLEPGKSTIIPPLAIASATSPQPSKGTVLVWTEANDKSTATIRQINLTLTNEGAQANESWRYKFPGARPRWIMGHLPSKGDHSITFVGSRSRGIGLYLLPWPDQNMPPVAPKSLINWPQDEFVATGATLNDHDEICGASLVWNGGKSKSTLELITWKVDADGNGEELHRDILPWSPMLTISEATVRVRRDGTPAVLMRSNDYSWSVWDGQKKSLSPVPAPYARTKKYIDISFLNQDEIVIIGVDPQRGFSIKRMDGSDLPQSFL